MIENMQHAIMHWQAGPQYARYNQCIDWHRNFSSSQNSCNLFLFVPEFLTDFIGKNYRSSFHIGTKTQTINLYGSITHLVDKLIQHRMLISQHIDHNHGVCGKSNYFFMTKQTFVFIQTFSTSYKTQ